MVAAIGSLTLGFGGTAGAAGKIQCTALTGSASSTITLSGCSGGNTGGGSQPEPATALATGGTITWLSGASTTIGTPVLAASVGKKCPGYVKNAASNPTAEAFTASVTADQGDGVLLPGAVKGSVCVGTTGSITLLKTVKFSWASSSIFCSTLSGNAASTITVSGCTGGDTGGGSSPLPATALATGGTITWLSGGSTTIGAPVLASTSSKKCPGYVKGAPGNPTAEKFTAAVTSDTGDGLKLPGTIKGAVCIGSDGSITALKTVFAK
jgi:hypothetical protein